MPFMFEGTLEPGGVADAIDDSPQLGIHQNLEVHVKWTLKVLDDRHTVENRFLLTSNREWKLSNYCLETDGPGGLTVREVVIKFVKGQWKVSGVTTGDGVMVLEKSGFITNRGKCLSVKIGDDQYSCEDPYHPSYKKIWGVSEDYLWTYQGEAGAYASGKLDIITLATAPPAFTIPQKPRSYVPPDYFTMKPNVLSFARILLDVDTRFKYVAAREATIVQKANRKMQEFNKSEQNMGVDKDFARYEKARAEIEKLLRHVEGFSSSFRDPKTGSWSCTYKLNK